LTIAAAAANTAALKEVKMVEWEWEREPDEIPKALPALPVLPVLSVKVNMPASTVPVNTARTTRSPWEVTVALSLGSSDSHSHRPRCKLPSNLLFLPTALPRTTTAAE
jgi:hypothetical protein